MAVCHSGTKLMHFWCPTSAAVMLKLLVNATSRYCVSITEISLTSANCKVDCTINLCLPMNGNSMQLMTCLIMLYNKDWTCVLRRCIMAELSDGQPLFPGDSDIDQLYIVQRLMGPLCRQHDILFLKNSRFAGLKFPDMSNPETLNKKYCKTMAANALSFIKYGWGWLWQEPAQLHTLKMTAAINIKGLQKAK